MIHSVQNLYTVTSEEIMGSEEDELPGGPVTNLVSSILSRRGRGHWEGAIGHDSWEGRADAPCVQMDER